MARLVDNTARVLADIERQVAARVKAVALTLRVEHKKDLSKPYPNASRPGEFPARRTGNLRDSVVATPLGKVAWRVGYESQAPYVVRLADLGRETVVTSAVRHMAKLRRVAEGK